MRRDHWEKIELLVEQALDMPPEKRAKFLKKKCGADDNLREEIESLLKYSETVDPFIKDIEDNVVSPSIAGLMEEKFRQARDDLPGMEGRKIAHYQIIGELGRGGMGVVYKARDTKLDRLAALKFLSAKALQQVKLKNKLIREARAAAALNHPNTATVYEINESDGQIFIAMEYIDGVTLRKMIENAAIGINQVLQYSISIGDALAEAHDKGVIHLDIKPENIMVDVKGRIKVMDFGLAQFRDSRMLQTETGGAGTPEYMSPEQIRGNNTSRKSDLWSLGVVMYEMLAGVRPFEGKSETSLLRSILEDDPPPVQKHQMQIPNELNSIVGKLLQKQPEDRYENTDIFLDDCLHVLKKLHAEQEELANTLRIFRVPKPLTIFVGRKRELQALDQLLKTSRLLTLTGVAGSGKTRLAIELAHQTRQWHDGAIFFIDLSAIRDPEMVIPSISRALDLKETASKSVAEVLKEHLHTKNWILILDNFEQVSEAAPAIADILINAPDCKFVVTSRQPLHIQGESEFAVPPLSLPKEYAGENKISLDDYESTTLFIQRAKQVNPVINVTPEIRYQIAEICIYLDGLPLAIELAAVHIKTLSPGELLQRLNDRFEILTAGTGDLPARQRSLRTAIEWSYDLLTGQEQMLFKRLAVFTGGFTMQAAGAVCNPGRENQADIVDGIFSLLNKNLIYKSSTSDNSHRFGILESIKEFAAECLSQSGEYVPMRDAHRHYFVDFCEQILPQFTGPDQSELIKKLDKDYENLIKALEWKSDIQIEVRNNLIICNVLWRYWLRKCIFSEGRKRLHEHIRKTDTEQHKELAAEAMLGAGTLAHNNGDYEEAFHFISRCLQLYRKAGKKPGIAKALTNLGWVEFRRSNYTDTRALSEEAFELQKQLGNKSGVAFALNNLGWVAHHQGDFVKAQQYHEKSLMLRREEEDMRNIAFSLTNTAWAMQKLGIYEKAEAHFEEALSLFEKVDDRQLYTFTSCLKAELLADHGSLEPAIALITDEVIPTFRKIEDTYGLALALNSLGVIHFRNQQYVKAAEPFAESIRLRKEIGDRWGTAQALCSAGRAMLHAERKGSILNDLLESYSIRREIGDKNGLAETIEAFSEYLYLQKSQVDAWKLVEIAAMLREILRTPRPWEKATIFCVAAESFEKEISKQSIKQTKSVSDLLQITDEIVFSIKTD